MREQNALLDHDFANTIGPHRKPILESELAQVVGAFQIKLTTGAFLRAERNQIMVTEAEKFRYVTPHHNAPERRRQCRDEQSMIATRDRTRDRAGGITAESVCHEPFAIEQELARHVCTIPRHRPNHGPACFKLLVHQFSMQTAKWVSPIFFFLVDGAALSPAGAAARWSLPPARSNSPASRQPLLRVHRRKPTHSTRAFPIRNRAAAPGAVPVRE